MGGIVSNFPETPSMKKARELLGEERLNAVLREMEKHVLKGQGTGTPVGILGQGSTHE